MKFFQPTEKVARRVGNFNLLRRLNLPILNGDNAITHSVGRFNLQMMVDLTQL
jgi:hypothetical protein